VITLLLTHLDAAGVAASLAQYPDPGRVVVCHGGRREDFDAVAHDRKLFVEDPSLRGPLERQSYAEVLRQAWREQVAGDERADLVWLAEYDHIVLRQDFERALRAAIDHAGADFVGKSCSRKDDTNWPHALRARTDPRLRDGALWGCLGTGMLMRRPVLEALAGLREIPGYLELAIPTAVARLGFRLDDVDRFSDLYAYVNAPPDKDAAALRAAASEGHFFVHPFKQVHLVASALRRGSGPTSSSSSGTGAAP
jgi:hypothetical protein